MRSRNMMVITAKFFATFREVVGTNNLEMHVDRRAVVSNIIDVLEQQYPAFEGRLRKLALVAVNETYVQRQQKLQPKDVVAFFPPVSGG
ncbi:molybdopterin synthase sulfur carrier subunit [candidate division KSB3 bacterium]|uniref:Molybdopterin synthase sulfur carrier subunit n=1 Tax=candidate division KSB3 bacterium TaxID=2044937 RepID=A0A2G6KB17_9BACT|nr:MAG: molybdopterin synthase sulfur carrier subunit [candidate division KSB3 bacterium]